VKDTCRRGGLVIDASQTLGAYPLDIRRIDPDSSSPSGINGCWARMGWAIIYAAPKWRREGRPIEYSWLAKAGSDNFAQLVNYRDEFREGARRFDMGEYSGFITFPWRSRPLSQIWTGES